MKNCGIAKSKFKYDQLLNYLLGCDKQLSIEKIDMKFMLKFRNWFLNLEYKNPTIVKAFRNFRCFLKWAKSEGYTFSEDAINYQVNITVRQKKVIFLKFDELLMLYHHDFSAEKKHLEKVRDLFCFMAFTSLRYSDLSKLKVSDVYDDHIEIYTEKTDALLNIPIVSYVNIKRPTLL